MKLWSSLTQVGVNVKSISRFKKDETVWGGELGEPLQGCKPKDVPDTHAVRAGGTNWGVLVMFLYLTPKYLCCTGPDIRC